MYPSDGIRSGAHARTPRTKLRIQRSVSHPGRQADVIQIQYLVWQMCGKMCLKKFKSYGNGIYLLIIVFKIHSEKKDYMASNL